MDRLTSLLQKYNFSFNGSDDSPELWTHKDHILITYADMVRSDVDDEQTHMGKLHQFLNERLRGVVSSVHILPFFPYSSDDGFSIIDYRQVDEQKGTWGDVSRIGKDFRLMADMVINHTSRFSPWFRKFLKREIPFDDYYMEVEKGADLSIVVRPRSSPVITKVQTESGSTRVWTTFSPDQVDVNFSNPDVFFEFMDIFLFYISKGVRVIRLDAVAFIWKEPGTPAIHMPQTHEIVKLYRTVVENYAHDVTLITETNVPHKENVSYFGEGDEAHMVYQFSLPPLLLHALLNGNASHLTRWASSLQQLPGGCTYFNFTSSHDGIGVRPLEGLIPEVEFYDLVRRIEESGGLVSYRERADGTRTPYELNTTYFDAFAGAEGGEELQKQRYFCSQLVMLSLQGVPGIYMHNLLGSRNYNEGVKLTGSYRTINRQKFDYSELNILLNQEGGLTKEIFEWYKNVMQIRAEHPAFHPLGNQEVYNLDERLFTLVRSDTRGREKILVVGNLSGDRVAANTSRSGLLAREDGNYRDVLTGEEFAGGGEIELEPYRVVWLKV